MLTLQPATSAFTFPFVFPVRPSRLHCSRTRRMAAPTCVSRTDFSVAVYLVTDRRTTPGLTVEQIVDAALRGDASGKCATIVQLRDKNVSRDDSLQLGRKLRLLTSSHDAAFVVNDDIGLALELQADGVHLGQDDASVAAARETLGNDAIVGMSVATPEEAENAIRDGADYVGVGAVFETGTKADAGKPIGEEGLAHVVRTVHGRIPVVAIGGIGVGNASVCKRAGANGVAVVSAIMKSERPGEVAAELARIVGGEGM